MFENMDFSKMSEILKQVQEKANALENDLETKEFSASSGGNLVKITANGKGEIIDVNIDESLLEDKEALQILLISAINDALKMVEQNRQSLAGNLFGGLK